MTPERIRRAAEILRDTATCMQESVTTPPHYEWSDEMSEDEAATKPECDEMMALAAELEELATR